MNCRNCNTPFNERSEHCPNCGWHPPGVRLDPAPRPAPGPRLVSPLAMSDGREEDLPEARREPAAAVAAEVAPEPAAEANEPAPRPPEPVPQAPVAPEPAPKPAAEPAPKPAPAPAPVPAATSAPAPAREPDGTRSLAAPDPAGLRALLAQRPELLEPGLQILHNERGDAIGASYRSAVGEIDLVARDASGRLVVVLVSDPGSGEELVAQVLQRIGWVRKHLGDGGERVRGIVLVEEPPESLSYAAAAVSDTVAFKTWRIALSFSDLEI